MENSKINFRSSKNINSDYKIHFDLMLIKIKDNCIKSVSKVAYLYLELVREFEINSSLLRNYVES